MVLTVPTVTLFCPCSQSRKLDVYFEYEEKLMSKSTLDKSLLDIISDPDGKETRDLQSTSVPTTLAYSGFVFQAEPQRTR